MYSVLKTSCQPWRRVMMHYGYFVINHQYQFQRGDASANEMMNDQSGVKIINIDPGLLTYWHSLLGPASQSGSLSCSVTICSPLFKHGVLLKNTDDIWSVFISCQPASTQVGYSVLDRWHSVLDYGKSIDLQLCPCRSFYLLDVLGQSILKFLKTSLELPFSVAWS